MTHQLNFIYNDSDWICPSEYPDLSNAKDKSVFGSPTFIVGSELFWGDARLEDAIEWARK